MAQSESRTFRLVLISACITVLATSCLKSRLQLKDDDDHEAAKPQQADVQEVQPQGQYVVDELKSEITKLEGRLEDVERGQKDVSKTQSLASKDEQKKLEARIVELENAQANMLETIKKLQDQESAAADPNEFLEKAKAQFQAEKYDAAIESLNIYLKNAKGKKTEDATFIRAESYYKIKQFKKAIVDYSKFPEKFTKSDKMPVALYKIGLSFDALGMHEDAKGFYAELIDKFPKTAEAKKAKKKAK